MVTKFRNIVLVALLILSFRVQAAILAEMSRRCLAEDSPVGLSALLCLQTALALPASSGTQDLGRTRQEFIRLYTHLFRRYTGAGETSVHKATQRAVQLVHQRNYDDARALLDELLDDLETARDTKQIEPLMESGTSATHPIYQWT